MCGRILRIPPTSITHLNLMFSYSPTPLFSIIIIHFLTLSLPFSRIFFSILTLPFVNFFNLNIGYWFSMSYGGDWSWALCLLMLCGIWVFSFSRKKDVGFFPFWANECVLNCNLDVYAWLVRKCRKIRDF